MSSIYSNADLRFQEKLGADKLEETRQNIDVDTQLFNKQEVCKKLNIGLSSLNKLLRSGAIKSAPVGVKRTLFTYQNIKDYIDLLNKEVK